MKPLIRQLLLIWGLIATAVATPSVLKLNDGSVIKYEGVDDKCHDETMKDVRISNTTTGISTKSPAWLPTLRLKCFHPNQMKPVQF